MEHPVKGIDHVFLLVQDLDRSQQQFERLGFTVSPRGMHSASKGTANHTIMFPKDYFELLGIVTPVEGNAARRAALESNGEGLSAIACRITDAEAAKTALTELGIATGPVGHFERPVPLPGGGTAPAAFATLPFDDSERPFGTMFMCQHKTRETVWLPDLLEHANGATGLSEVFAQSETPAEDAERFARLYAAGAVTRTDSGARVTTGPDSTGITLLTPAALAARFPGIDLSSLPKHGFSALSLHVKDLQATEDFLTSNSIPYSPTARGIALAPKSCSGMILEFAPQ